jgi:hypothetical protein
LPLPFGERVSHLGPGFYHEARRSEAERGLSGNAAESRISVEDFADYFPLAIAHSGGVRCRQESCTENGAQQKTVAEKLSFFLRTRNQFAAETTRLAWLEGVEEELAAAQARLRELAVVIEGMDDPPVALGAANRALSNCGEVRAEIVRSIIEHQGQLKTINQVRDVFDYLGWPEQREGTS